MLRPLRASRSRPGSSSDRVRHGAAGTGLFASSRVTTSVTGSRSASAARLAGCAGSSASNGSARTPGFIRRLESAHHWVQSLPVGNADQHDTDSDGIGDECDPFPGSSAGAKANGGGGFEAEDGDRATFSVSAQAKSAEAPDGKAKLNTHGPDGFQFTSTEITSVIEDGNEATVRGTGMYEGQEVNFRIDLVDGGSLSDDTIRWQIDGGVGYDSGVQVVRRGNVSVG